MAKKEFKFTGYHAAAVFGGAFTVIIGVNIALAYNAIRTFPGLEVKNSYVASQEFNAKLSEQQSLGWTIWAEEKDDQVILSITDADGNPVEVDRLDAVIGRATQIKDDQTPEFVFDGKAYVAQASLADGNWNIRMTAVSRDGRHFQQRVILHVKD